MSAPSFCLRRCEILLLEPREDVRFALDDLLAGGNGLVRELGWVALAAHLDTPVPVTAAQRELLGTLSPSQWQHVPLLPAQRDDWQALLDAGLVLRRDAEDDAGRGYGAADERLRAAHWHPLAATLHAFSRWDGVDAVKNTRDSGTDTAAGMREVLGPPPSTAPAHSGPGFVLPEPAHDGFDELLARRATCRNFDDARALPLALFSTMLGRVFGARARVRVGADLVFEKKNHPSGGGLHPMEAYLIVQHVEGLAPGIYHYQSEGHVLHPVAGDGAPLDALAMECLGQQDWFANAHCLVVLAPRFDRTFWKYRRHAKGYRVVALEAGHLSQTLYLSATDLGLGAFITGAINERRLEAVLGLDPVRQGALAMCGFGWRAASMTTAELDPLQKVWVRASPA